MNDVRKIYVVAGIMVVIFIIVFVYLRKNSNNTILDSNESVLSYENVTTVSKEELSEQIIIQEELTTEVIEEESEENSMFTSNLSDYVGFIVVSTFVAKEGNLNAILSVAYDDYSNDKAMYLWRTGFNNEDGMFINISTYDLTTGEFLSYMKQYTGDEILNDDISDILYYEESDNSITVYK